ncbi:hypothetical protein CTI12_AA602720 [Artemisia annua]|uniref:Uncharacterized protein n=1 Tax=Artemisia annua TaxID=35608 RepID=A0A2U1KH95_ARTAN|nr:hypothetical protein CTI12_AA602720 [Artemisia annua]
MDKLFYANNIVKSVTIKDFLDDFVKKISFETMGAKKVLKIHAVWSAKCGESDYEGVVKVDEGFNGADLRNVYTKLGMSVIRTQSHYVTLPKFHKDYIGKIDILIDTCLFSFHQHT